MPLFLSLPKGLKGFFLEKNLPTSLAHQKGLVVSELRARVRSQKLEVLHLRIYCLVPWIVIRWMQRVHASPIQLHRFRIVSLDLLSFLKEPELVPGISEIFIGSLMPIG